MKGSGEKSASAIRQGDSPFLSKNTQMSFSLVEADLRQIVGDRFGRSLKRTLCGLELMGDPV